MICFAITCLVLALSTPAKPEYPTDELIASMPRGVEQKRTWAKL